jgi:hypothetical protein
MATWAYPPLPPDSLEREADSALARELEWLLRSLQDSLAALREGLRDCAALLAPKEPGSTLVLSSHRSECVKGFVTRVGTKVVKGVCFCATLLASSNMLLAMWQLMRRQHDRTYNCALALLHLPVARPLPVYAYPMLLVLPSSSLNSCHPCEISSIRASMS